MKGILVAIPLALAMWALLFIVIILVNQ